MSEPHKSKRPLVDLTAHCACGAVSLRLNGTIRAMLLCSCLDCQKASGTGHTSAAMVLEADVTVTGPVKTFERAADSGATFIRTFCPVCATPILGRSSRAVGTVLIPVGLFGTDAEWFMPNQLIFARSHHEWDSVAPELPRYETYRESTP
jgi:hypothetical protein